MIDDTPDKHRSSAGGTLHTRFELDATAVGRQLHGAMSALLAEACGGVPIRTGTELSAALGIDVNLAWKVLKICRPAAGASTLLRLPGDGALRILLAAAEGKGVSTSAVDRVRLAFEAYDRLVLTHAGSRLSLDSLLANLAGDEQPIDLATRRAAFRANAAVLGVQASVQTAAYFFWPETIDGVASSGMAIVRGMSQFRRLRPDVSWVIGRGRRTDHQARLYGHPFPMPLDTETAERHGGVPLVQFLSSWELPPVRRTISPDGMAIDRIVGGPVGLQGSQSFFLAETMRPGLGRRNDPSNPTLRLVVSSHTPCETLVFDALFHKDLPPLGPPRVITASELGGDSLGYTAVEDRVTLNLGAEVEDHGPGLDTLHIAELPRYPELLGSVCERLAVNPADLHAWRVRIAFPPIPCGVLIERDMNPA